MRLNWEVAYRDSNIGDIAIDLKKSDLAHSTNRCTLKVTSVFSLATRVKFFDALLLKS